MNDFNKINKSINKDIKPLFVINYIAVNLILMLVNITLYLTNNINKTKLSYFIFYLVLTLLTILFLIYFYYLNNKKKINKILFIIYDWLTIITISFSILFLIIGNLFKIGVVKGNSMEPNLHNNQKIIIYKYNPKIKKEDVIIIPIDKNSNPIIKRVIATEGDTITYDKDNQKILINGKDNYKSYFFDINFRITYNDFNMMTKYKDKNNNLISILDKDNKIKKDFFIYLGDNINNSLDSRINGAVKYSDIIGRLLKK